MVHKTIITIALFLFATPALAAPTVQQLLAGTVDHGETVVIGGLNFGNKNGGPHANPVLPVFYSDFEHGTSGANIGTGNPATIGTYLTDDSNGGIEPQYSSAVTRQNSGMSGRSLSSIGKSALGSLIDPTQEIYVDAWLYYDSCVYEAWQVKIFRAYTVGTNYPNFVAAWRCEESGYQACGYEVYPSDCADDITWYGPLRTPDNNWGHIQINVFQSDLDTPNGFIKWWLDGAQSRHVSGLVNRDSDCGNNGTFDELYWAQYYDDSPSSVRDIGGCPDIGDYGCDANFYWDNMYMDNTPARVEISGSSVYNSTSQREIQIPTAWSPTSISVTVNTGAFNTNDTAYIYVTDSNGDVSNPLEITIGETATTDTVAPAAPAPPPIALSGETAQVTLNWSANSEPDVSFYTVHWNTTGLDVDLDSYQVAGTTSDITYTHTNLLDNETYYYVITCTDTSQNRSERSGQSSATTASVANPTAPTGGSAGYAH